MAALAGADIVDMLLDLYEKSLCFEIGYHSLSRFISVHTRVLAAVLLVDRSVVVHDVEYRQVVAQSHLVVVGVMSRGDLYNAGSEVHFNILVGDDRYLSVGERQLHGLADNVLVSLVVRVNRNRRIAEKRFGTRGGDLHEAAAVGERVVDMPEVTLLLLVLALYVRDRGLAARTPVDDALAVVNESLFIIVYEHLLDCLGAAVVKGEALTLPVAGRTQLFELILYLAAVFVSPVPCAFEEAVTSDVVLRHTVFLHLCDYLCFCRDRSVVGSGQPQCGVALHTLCADKYILQGLVKRMTHVELPRNVRGRDNYGVGLFFGVALGVEVLLVLPVPVDALLEVFRGVGFCEFLFHFRCFLSFLAEMTAIAIMIAMPMHDRAAPSYISGV